MKKIAIKIMTNVLTFEINVLKRVVRIIDTIRFKLTGHRPVIHELVEEGIDYDTYRIRFTEVPTETVVSVMLTKFFGTKFFG